MLQKAAGDAVEAQLHKIELRPGYPHPRKPQSSPEEGYGMATTYLQGAVVVIDNHTGGISALVGGRDYGDSKLNRAFSLRQVGSTFKPFVYAAAFSVVFCREPLLMILPSAPAKSTERVPGIRPIPTG